jgi:replicative DNA helicase
MQTREYTTDEIAGFERAVLGGVLLDNGRLSLLPELEPADFVDLKNAAVFAAMRNLEATGKPLDVVTIDAELVRREQAESIGAPAYLAILQLDCPTVDNTLEYARIVRSASLSRKVRLALAETLEAAARWPLDGAEILGDALARLVALDAEQPMETSTIGNAVISRMKQLDAIMREREAGGLAMTGYPTGVAKLDEKIGGWQPGIVTIVAARPGVGKSSLGLATADACSKANVGVHLFTLEDSQEAYADRALSRLSGVSAEKLRNADLQRGELEKTSRAIATLTGRKGWIIDQRSGISASEIVRSVRRCRKANTTKVVIVDYVQLVKRNRERGESSHDALTEIVTTLADAAKQDRIAYVVMSQLNRSVESRSDKRPQLADLRESGSLEERAKCVVALYRGSMYGDPQPHIDWDPDDYKQRKPTDIEHRQTIQLLVLKNSNGRTGVVKALWEGECTRVS